MFTYMLHSWIVEYIIYFKNAITELKSSIQHLRMVGEGVQSPPQVCVQWFFTWKAVLKFLGWALYSLLTTS